MQVRFSRAKVGFAALVLIISVVTFFSCTSRKDGSPTGDSGPLRIGIVLPLTGDSAAWGEQGRYGVETAVEEVNTAGGINGRKLEPVFEDSKAEAKTAVSAIQKLISVDKVSAVVGDITSAATLAMAPVAERSKVVLIAPTASAPAISQAGTYIFRVWPSDLLEGRAIAEFAADSSFKRAVILFIQTDYGTGLRDVFTTVFQEKGGEVILTQGYNKDETDFKPLLLKVAGAKPDAVYIVGYYKDSALILKQAQEIGLKTQFLGATAVESKDLPKIAGNAAEGLIYPTISDFDPDHPTPLAKAFIEKFTKKFGKAPDWASSHTHDAILVLAEAMKKGGTSGSEIQQAIDANRRFEGVTGNIIFDDNGDVIDKPVVIKVVQNGAFKVYKPAR